MGKSLTFLHARRAADALPIALRDVPPGIETLPEPRVVPAVLFFRDAKSITKDSAKIAARTADVGRAVPAVPFWRDAKPTAPLRTESGPRRSPPRAARPGAPASSARL